MKYLLVSCFLLGMFDGRVGKHIESQHPDNASHMDEELKSTLEVGKTINIFPRYGSFVHTMKIWSSTTGGRLSSETSMSILHSDSVANISHEVVGADKFEDDFVIDFCDDEDSLLSSFFDNFQIGGVAKSYKAFTAFSSRKGIAQALGIHSSFWGKQHSFVLVRLFKRKHRTILNKELRLASNFVESVQKIRTGSGESAHRFMEKFGSHIVADYETGDVFYQVFIFGEHVYREMKKNYFILDASLGSTPTILAKKRAVEDYFTPYFALHIGQVKLASDHHRPLSISQQLETRYFVFRVYESIFHILGNAAVEKEIEKLDGEVIIGMKLNKLTKLLWLSPETFWLRLILDNTLALYYVTIRNVRKNSS